MPASLRPLALFAVALLALPLTVGCGEATPGPGDPSSSRAGAAEKLGARHLLVMYLGSERAPASVTRSKDEARALATQAAKEAHAPGARFEDLDDGGGYLFRITKKDHTVLGGGGNICAYPVNSAAAYTISRDKAHTKAVLIALLDMKPDDAAARHELFHTQIGVGNRLDGGRRRVKKYLWSFFRTAPAGQVRL